MNRDLYINSVRFVVLVLAQVLMCRHLHFLGGIRPFVYLLFVAWFPVRSNRLLLIFLAFLLGLTIDIFQDSGGIHAAACVFIAYVRPLALKFSFGVAYEYQTMKFNTVSLRSKIIYISVLTVLHHFVLFYLEVLSVSKLSFILQNTLLSSIFTVFLCTALTVVFSRKPE